MEVSKYDIEQLKIIRANVDETYRIAVEEFDRPGIMVLDIGPAKDNPIKFQHATVETMDIDPAAGCTHTVDICAPSNMETWHRFDIIICCEVLEHTNIPDSAVWNLSRLLRGGGIVFATTPFDFRIHGPLPDMWRFTEHGIRHLFQEFEKVDITPIENPERPLMPVCYRTIAKK